MNESTQNMLIFLGGIAVGSLAVLALSKNKEGLRPALADLTANVLDLRNKAAGAFQRTKEDLGDFMAEVEHARAAKEATPEAKAE